MWLSEWKINFLMVILSKVNTTKRIYIILTSLNSKISFVWNLPQEKPVWNALHLSFIGSLFLGIVSGEIMNDALILPFTFKKQLKIHYILAGI